MSDTTDMIIDPENIHKNQRLGSIRLRDTHSAAAKSAAYSRTVSHLRWFLPVLALIAVLTIIIWPYWHAHQISVTMVENVPNLMIENLNLTGLDTKNQPYAVTATRALQSQKSKDVIGLENPTGRITLDNGANITGKAKKGRLQQEERKLWLGGNVILTHDQGYRFQSEEMYVDMNNSSAWGDQPVVIQGNFGTAEGSGFSLDKAGEKMIIKGPAKAKIRMTPSDQGLHPATKADKPKDTQQKL